MTEGWEQRLATLTRAQRRARWIDLRGHLARLADRCLPPRARWLLGDDAMLHQRDLRRIADRNNRRSRP